MQFMENGHSYLRIVAQNKKYFLLSVLLVGFFILFIGIKRRYESESLLLEIFRVVGLENCQLEDSEIPYFEVDPKLLWKFACVEKLEPKQSSFIKYSGYHIADDAVRQKWVVKGEVSVYGYQNVVSSDICRNSSCSIYILTNRKSVFLFVQKK